MEEKPFPPHTRSLSLTSREHHNQRKRGSASVHVARNHEILISRPTLGSTLPTKILAGQSYPNRDSLIK